MNHNLDAYAKYFLEVSSEQRLKIIQLLSQNTFTLSELAKEIDATKPEIHRNLDRLEKSGFIRKNSSGNFVLTTLGQMILGLVPNLAFVIDNKKYFMEHPINSLPEKFISRFGELFESKLLKSYVDVFEYWKSIYEEAEEYIYNILYDVPYFDDFVKPINKKLSQGVKIKSIFYEKAIVSDSRNDAVKKLKKYIDAGDIQRMMTKTVSAAVILNEKQSCLIFPNTDGKLDAGYALVSDDALFHQWCFDYFNYSWYNAQPFMERKLEKK
ncbi:helix-turn-helix domain-containing protein [Nitrosopumilus sp. K4]|uniref:helix-turn-helix transcriptional regulator n=1 Tax=Nitrosopumilus sp. K4 TaxID=2795383 RepID=UPI001BAC6076|nr:helix-turn-helix domain-containing protein [Nitrosopumilus sp. K4]QUC64806.1 helix-turn-helix domain-containing protein [Nitrosopumilus sp. K4]